MYSIAQNNQMEEGKGYAAGLINRCIIKPGTGICGGRVSRNPMQLNVFFAISVKL